MKLLYAGLAALFLVTGLKAAFSDYTIPPDLAVFACLAAGIFALLRLVVVVFVESVLKNIESKND